MEVLLGDIISTYGPQLWLSFITLVITGFVLTFIRGFVGDITYYIKARFSDIGFGQHIIYQNNPYVVEKITFKYIVISDDKQIIRIPIRLYMSGPISFPHRKRRHTD